MKYRYQFDRIMARQGELVIVCTITQSIEPSDFISHRVWQSNKVSVVFQPIPDDSFHGYLSTSETCTINNLINAVSLIFPVGRSFNDLSQQQKIKVLERILDNAENRQFIRG